MGTVVSYDVSDKNPEMKSEMASRGYRDGWLEGPEGNKTKINLPNSTLWHQDKSPQQGLQDMKEAAAKLRIKLERAVALDDAVSPAIPGDPHR